MVWRWRKKTYKDERFPGPDFLVCKAASKRFIEEAFLKTCIFQFAEKEKYKKRVKIPQKTETKITVSEYGRGIELSGKDLLPPREYDKDDIIQKTLIRQMVITFDRISACALKSNPLKVTTSTSILKKIIRGARWNDIEAVCGIISTYMPFYAPPYEGNNYIGIGGTRLLRGVKNHRHFLPWQGYLKPGDVLFNNEIGKTNNIRWIECKDIKCFLNDGVIFGKEGLLTCAAEPIELRIYEKVIAWYGFMGCGGQDILYIPERRKGWK